MNWPTKRYSIIYADPPWQYQDKGCNGNAEAHYSTMGQADICRLPVSELANPDCVLFIWATYPMLPQALETISKWGFKYKSIAFQWVKLNKKNGRPFYGLGRWTRGNTEPCLLAVKGKPKRINNSVFQLIQTPIEGHSKKPDVVRENIVRLVGDLPRIELFARQQAHGWDAWGNQVGQPELTIEPAVE
jgi:N6-adenosine-specific RNA methylase IME4